jgi:hypothetical protein
MAARFNFALHEVSRVGKDMRVRLRSDLGPAKGE